MKRGLRMLMLSFILVLAMGCNKEVEMKRIITNNQYILEIPSEMKTNEHLDTIASLQYWDRWKEFYLFVIDEEKSELRKRSQGDTLTYNPATLQGHKTMISDTYLKQFTRTDSVAYADGVINGLPTSTLYIMGKMHKAKVLYAVHFVEGKDNMYQVVAIVPRKRAESYREVMDSIFHSFQEVSNEALQED